MCACDFCTFLCSKFHGYNFLNVCNFCMDTRDAVLYLQMSRHCAVHVHMCMHARTRLLRCMHVWLHVCMPVCMGFMHACTYGCDACMCQYEVYVFMYGISGRVCICTCMYACMCLYRYKSVYAFKYVCTFFVYVCGLCDVCMYGGAPVCVCGFMCACMGVSMFVCMYVCYIFVYLM